MMIISDEDVIDESIIPAQIHEKRIERQENIESNFIPTAQETSLKELMSQYEKKVLAHYLSAYKPMKRCADVLGIDFTTLARKKKRYNL
ncbi:hypothetical protein FZC66_06365 [Priestia megaterium]|nr:hypothetical protein FZC66_06365 [Priestia megaterium]